MSIRRVTVTTLTAALASVGLLFASAGSAQAGEIPLKSFGIIWPAR